jgi:hypothetical protein
MVSPMGRGLIAMAKEWRFALSGAFAMSILGVLIAWGYWTYRLEQAASTVVIQAQSTQSVPAQTPPPPSPARNLPTMKLVAQYAAPLRDTIIQQLENPTDGTTCYLYTPILVHHSPPMPTGFVDYGANGIGSISCFPKTR